jgi:hypothetical protein
MIKWSDYKNEFVVYQKHDPRSKIPASGNKRILSGTVGKDHRIRPEFNGNHRIMGAVFRAGMSSDFSGDFRLTSGLFRWENSPKSPEKSEDIPARNTAPMIR